MGKNKIINLDEAKAKRSTEDLMVPAPKFTEAEAKAILREYAAPRGRGWKRV